MIEQRREKLVKSESDFNARAESAHERWMSQQNEINEGWKRMRQQLGLEQEALQSM